MKSWYFCHCWCLGIKHFHHVFVRFVKGVQKTPTTTFAFPFRQCCAIGCYSAGAKMAVTKLSRWQPDFLCASSGCRGSFSREHHAAAKISLHKSVRLSLHLSLCCSCQQRRVVCLAAPRRCCATWKGYFDRGGSAQKAFLISDFHPRFGVGAVCVSHEDKGWYLNHSFWPMQQHPDVERTSPFGGGHYGFQATKA